MDSLYLVISAVVVVATGVAILFSALRRRLFRKRARGRRFSDGLNSGASPTPGDRASIGGRPRSLGASERAALGMLREQLNEATIKAMRGDRKAVREERELRHIVARLEEQER